MHKGAIHKDTHIVDIERKFSAVVQLSFGSKNKVTTDCLKSNKLSILCIKLPNYLCSSGKQELLCTPITQAVGQDMWGA